jgi:hypothetical protein
MIVTCVTEQFEISAACPLEMPNFSAPLTMCSWLIDLIALGLLLSASATAM